MTRNQSQLLCCASPYRFNKHGATGTSISELLPETARIIDEVCLIRSLQTDPINHDPAVTFLQTGSSLAGRPCIGSWTTWGLGSENDNLPAFVVLISGKPIQPIQSRYWHHGFLPARHQGVQFRTTGDPVLFLKNPPGMNPESRRHILNGIRRINSSHPNASIDSEIDARIEAYEMAFHMQSSVPQLMELAGESKTTLQSYGAEPGAASFANNCLLARRLVERGVRFVQLYHCDWDNHNELPKSLPVLCRETDQATAALLTDLKQRGLLEDTLIVWGGEFGRTCYSQGNSLTNFGRDHHSKAFSVWLAGGGVRSGMTLGSTDEFGFNVVEDPVHVHDLQATILHCLGIDHERLVYRHLGRDFRLTDVSGRVVREILA